MMPPKTEYLLAPFGASETLSARPTTRWDELMTVR